MSGTPVDPDGRRGGPGGTILWYGMPADGPGWPIELDVERIGLARVRLEPRTLRWDEVLAVADAVVVPLDVADVLPEGFASHARREAVQLLCWDGPHTGAVAGAGGTVVERGDVDAMAEHLAVTMSSPGGARAARRAIWRSALADLEVLLPVEVPLP